MKPLLLLLFVFHLVLAQHVSPNKKVDPKNNDVVLRKSANVLINSRNFLHGKFVNRGIKGNPNKAKYYTAFAPIDRLNKVVNLPESLFFPSENVLMNSKHRIKKVLPPYMPELLIRYKRSAGRSKPKRTTIRKAPHKRKSRKIEIERTVKKREPRRVSRDRKGKGRKHRSRRHKRKRNQNRENQGRRKRSVDELNITTEVASNTPITITKRHLLRQDAKDITQKENISNTKNHTELSSINHEKLARRKNDEVTEKSNTTKNDMQVHLSRRRHSVSKSKREQHQSQDNRNGKRGRSRNHQKHKQKSHKKKNGRQRRFKKKNSRRSQVGNEQSKVPPSRRLIAGKDGHIQDYPYVVSIQKHGEHWCAGALLNQKIVVTTANCVWKSDGLSRLSVRAGSSYINSGGQEAWVREVVKHPKWSIRSNPECDVALLLLDRTLRFSNTIHAADLPNRAMIPPFNDIFVTSWGSDRRDGVYVREERMLQVYHATLMNHEACNNITLTYGVAVSDNFFCAKQSGYRGPCTRDTGAPAVSDGVIWGLASWSIRKKCGTERFPSMFSYLGSNQNYNFLTMGMKRLMSDVRENPFLDRFPRILYRIGNATKEHVPKVEE